MPSTQAHFTAERIQQLYDEAVALVVAQRRPSIGFVQSELGLGAYPLPAAFLEQMEKQGIVSPMTSRGTRDVLVGRASGLMDKLLGRRLTTRTPSTLLHEEDLRSLLRAAASHAGLLAQRDEDASVSDRAESPRDAVITVLAPIASSAPVAVKAAEPARTPAKPKEPQFRRDAIRAGGETIGYYVTRTDGKRKWIELQNARRELLGTYKEHTDSTSDARGNFLGKGNLLVTLGSQLGKLG